MMRSMHEYMLPFAAWELRLYLDTHPCDERALAAYRQLCASAGGKCNYACAVHCEGNRWNWIDSPWPWEYEANETEGCK